jgi:uncharacterized protein
MARINVFSSSKELLDKHESFLLENMLLNNLMLGILYRLKSDGMKKGDLLMSVEDHHQLILCMSGLYIILYANTDQESIYEEAVNYLDQHHISYPGIIGPVDNCESFKRAYFKLTNQQMNLLMNQRIYKNEKVIKVSDIEAKLLIAQIDDLSILSEWYYDFLKVTGEMYTIEYANQKMSEMIASKKVFMIKQNREIVSMAVSTRPFLTSVTVGCVYTPPQHRFRGYATKCVELLTEHLLKSYQYCTLYTDLSNPTSNSVYQKIGYVPIGDSCVYVIPNK